MRTWYCEVNFSFSQTKHAVCYSDISVYINWRAFLKSFNDDFNKPALRIIALKDKILLHIILGSGLLIYPHGLDNSVLLITLLDQIYLS